MDAFKEYLKKFPNYTPEAYTKALPFLTSIELKAGEHLLEYGKICRQIALIDQGLLRLYYLNEGKEVTNCFCKEKTISTSYTSLIKQENSKIAIQAVEDSSLILLSHDSLQKLYQQDLFWQQMGRMASEEEYITRENHSRFLLNLSATERYLQVLNEDNELLQRVPLTILASYLQVAPETLSRIRKRLSRT